MDDDALKKVKERLAELPQDVQEAIMANDFEERITTIGKTNRLHIDQIGELQDEVMLVMLGFSPIDGLSQRLQKALHLYDEQALTITTAVNNEIFLPIRESMKKIHEKQKVTPPTPPPTPVAAAPATPIAQTAEVAPIGATDIMLSQKTVSIPAQKPSSTLPAAPTAPTIGNSYKTDPYREPAE